MMKSSKQIVEELEPYGIIPEWFCEPSAEMYGTIEVNEHVDVIVHDSGYVKIMRDEFIYPDQPETIQHLASLVFDAIVDSEITC